MPYLVRTDALNTDDELLNVFAEHFTLQKGEVWQEVWLANAKKKAAWSVPVPLK